MIGNPDPILVWSKTNRQSSRSMMSGGKLLLKNVRRSDSGTYNCSAVNILGQAQALAQLILLIVNGKIVNEIVKLHETRLQWCCCLYVAPRDRSDYFKMLGQKISFFISRVLLRKASKKKIERFVTRRFRFGPHHDSIIKWDVNNISMTNI